MTKLINLGVLALILFAGIKTCAQQPKQKARNPSTSTGIYKASAKNPLPEKTVKGLKPGLRKDQQRWVLNNQHLYVPTQLQESQSIYERLSPGELAKLRARVAAQTEAAKEKYPTRTYPLRVYKQGFNVFILAILITLFTSCSQDSIPAKVRLPSLPVVPDNQEVIYYPDMPIGLNASQAIAWHNSNPDAVPMLIKYADLQDLLKKGVYKHD